MVSGNIGKYKFEDSWVDTAFGRWTLEREADLPTGLFTLVFELKNGEWVIVHDHTSAGDAGE